jgi:phosphoglycerate dehydrogenase-like enzyme
LIDESALVDAIQSGRLRGAALDCFRQEPPERNHPLLAYPQVIVTAHVSAQTDQAVNRMGWMALTSCLEVLMGKKPPQTVNPEVFQL